MELDGAKEVSGGLKKKDLAVAHSSDHLAIDDRASGKRSIVSVQEDDGANAQGEEVSPAAKLSQLLNRLTMSEKVELRDGVQLEEEIGGSGQSGRLVK